MTYNAPLRDMRFVLDEAARFGRRSTSLATGQGTAWHDGEVTTPSGFADAYARYVAGGWNALSCDPEYGGRGVPGIGRDFYTAKIGTARFDADNLLAQAGGLAHAVLHGTAGATALNEAQFAA